MPIRKELNKLHETDVWSLMLFVLYNFQKVPEYSSISELAYILDKKNLLKLCEYFGGTTIKIPTIQELETTLYAMLLYNYVVRENKKEHEAVALLNLEDKTKLEAIKDYYQTLKTVMEEYQLSSRGQI